MNHPRTRNRVTSILNSLWGFPLSSKGNGHGKLILLMIANHQTHRHALLVTDATLLSNHQTIDMLY